MAWFIGQSAIVIVLAFGLGVVVGWLLWARRLRLLTVEVVAARIRAAEHVAGRSPYGRRITWTSSGRIALDAHAPIAQPDRAASRRPSVRPEESGGRDETPDEKSVEWLDGDAADAVRPPEVGAASTGPHIPAPHIPAPRIEPADRDGFGVNAFDDDDDLDNDFDQDLDDAYDLVVDDDPARRFDAGFDLRFDVRFDPRFGDVSTTSDLRGLDRFRDLFTPSNGRVPRTPEPRRTEPEVAPVRHSDRDVDSHGDRDGHGNCEGARHPSEDRRTAGDAADDTTLAAAGLAGESSHEALESTPAVADAEPQEHASVEPASTEPAAVEPATVEPATVEPVSTEPPSVGPRITIDDLTRIDGIGPKAAAALTPAGIRTFDHLAAAGGDAVATALRTSGVRLTSGVHAWPLAAHRLAARRVTDAVGDAPDATSGSGGVNGNKPDGERDDRRGGLLPKRRSPSMPARRSIQPDALDPDDLARIEGIGPTFAAALVASGIRTFGQLANADELALRTALGNPQPNLAPSLPTWPIQARLLATGDEDGFAELTARLIAGRGVDDDLERIDGIGPQTSAALRAAGIRTFRMLAASDDDRLRAAIEKAGMRPAPRLTGWPAQARMLAVGDEERFSDLDRRIGDGHGERHA